MACYIINGKVRFDTSLYSLIRDDEVEIRLSKMETEVFAILCEHAEETVTRQFLFENAWPNGTGSDGHLNRVILLLRRKFDSLGLLDVIKTVPKVGYTVSDVDSCTSELEYTSGSNCNDVLAEAVPAINGYDSYASIDSGSESIPTANQGDENPKKNEVNSKHISYGYIILGGLGIALLSINLYLKLAFFGYGGSSLAGKGEGESTIFRVHKLYSNNLFSFYSTMRSNVGLQEKIKVMVSENNHEKVGHYYVNISSKAISILHLSDDHRSLGKRIYLRGRGELVEELGCILNTVNNEINLENVTSVRMGKNSTTRSLMSSVSPSCPIDHEETVDVNISITISSNTNENTEKDINRIFHMSMVGYANDSVKLFSVSTTGYVENYIDRGLTYEKWNAKTKNIKISSENFNGEPATIKLIDDILDRDVPFITRRVTDGVYISDILGGVVMSSR
ncbi:TPA: winged helix-turn-helix domain-containing protein [Aeromonas hydrophila]